MMSRRNRLCRAALVLALPVLAVTVIGVAESAANTVIPKQLTGTWERNGLQLTVHSSGEVLTWRGLHSRAAGLPHVTAHRLIIGGGPEQSCLGTGTYRWTFAKGVPGLGAARAHLKLEKIHDGCKWRVNLLTGTWSASTPTAPPLAGSWGRPNWGDDLLLVRPRGKVEIRENGRYFARFERVTAHRLRISGIRSCSGTGTYSWTIRKFEKGLSGGYQLKFTVIHDACKLRVNLLAINTNVQKDNSWYRN